jgi:hypothetical protein
MVVLSYRRTGDNGLDASPARKWRAMGRIEQALLDGGWRHPNRPKTFARNPLATPPYHKELQMFLSTTKGRSPVPWEWWELRPHERSRCAEHGGRVRAPPGVVMVSPPEVPRNASRAKGEGPAIEVTEGI